MNKIFPIFILFALYLAPSNQSITLDETLLLEYELSDFVSVPTKLADAHFQKITPQGI